MCRASFFLIVLLALIMVVCSVSANTLEMESQMSSNSKIENRLMNLIKQTNQKSEKKVGKIHLAYYVEAYCARCIDVLINSLRDAMEKIPDIIHLEVIPFGNGDENDGVITCQHGERECHANTLQGCAQHFYPSQFSWFPFIVCMESQDDPLVAAKSCAKTNKMDWQKLENCAKGEQGKKILYKNARKTLDLNPPNKYVPWLTVNGQPFEDPENIIAAVCSQYVQPDKAKYCTSVKRFGD